MNEKEAHEFFEWYIYQIPHDMEIVAGLSKTSAKSKKHLFGLTVRRGDEEAEIRPSCIVPACQTRSRSPPNRQSRALKRRFRVAYRISLTIGTDADCLLGKEMHPFPWFLQAAG
ncbi:hypothetical protein J2129_001131 [Methanofollis sp. W23]|uniref:hypothetical protein n=1 Tax=Methanofollis sp. W23 TaxID=2817849 RepID=UPI001AE1737B|nr:hypothetical protein [Methanofollis sp. W23]MBP2145677.1 hypothetical protein [Methanofollis sp. W23]